MERTLIGELREHIGERVRIYGWVSVRRDHGKLIFLDIRDRSGEVQCVVLPAYADSHATAQKLRSEWVVAIEGDVNKRPEKMMNEKDENGDMELSVTIMEVISEAEELAFEREERVNLDTYLDHLPLTLRTPRAQAIFRVQAHIVRTFREFLVREGFVEFQAPKIIGEDAEGGANSFDVEYFGHVAHLAQSPQLYKQIMVGVFERVFTVGNVYRAEKHSTTRHLNEYTSMDFEMGFIESHEDIMKMETRLLRFMMDALRKQCGKECALLQAEIPDVPEHIPSLKLREAQRIITEELGTDCTKEPDLEPQHERFLCEYAKKKFNSDFIFVTHFPLEKRPFYTAEDEKDPGYAKGFDLLFRGLEITTGAERIREASVLRKALESKKINPEKFSFYLEAFRSGMPPHGGIGLGLERLTARILGLENVKEATLFPRDMNRIDTLLSR